MAEEGLAPPLRVGLAVAVMEVLVLGHPVIYTSIVEGERDIIGDVERSVGVVRAYARETQSPGLVTHVEAGAGIVDRVQPGQAFVDVSPGVIVEVVVEPEEGLLLAFVPAGRIVEVQVVDPLPGQVALVTVVRVPVAFGRGVAVVEVSDESQVGVAVVLAIQVARVLVEVILEAHQDWPSVFGVDHRARELPVVAIDGAVGQDGCAIGAQRHVRTRWRHGELAIPTDRQHSRRREAMAADLDLHLIYDGVGQPERAWPELVARPL